MGVLMMAAASTMTNLVIFLALAFSLSLAAAVSYILFSLKGPKSNAVLVEPDYARLVKRKRAGLKLVLDSGSTTWFSLQSASAPKTGGVSLSPDEEGAPGSFTLVADYAGRHENLELTATFVDVLGIFRRVEQVKPRKFVVEVIPLSLLQPPIRPMVFALTSGELPARVKGFGQEFYEVQEYSRGAESKDILWKRVAKSPDRMIVARVREANIPRVLRVSLVRSTLGDATVWMDVVSETLGTLGTALIELGMGVEVSVQTLQGEVTYSAQDLPALVELVVQIWKEKALPEGVGALASSSDLVIAGSEAMTDRGVFKLSEDIPTLVVPESSALPRMGLRAKVISEGSDFENFLSSVIVR